LIIQISAHRIFQYFSRPPVLRAGAGPERKPEVRSVKEIDRQVFVL